MNNLFLIIRKNAHLFQCLENVAVTENRTRNSLFEFNDSFIALPCFHRHEMVFFSSFLPRLSAAFQLDIFNPVNRGMFFA